jgi:hypothetical protein
MNLKMSNKNMIWIAVMLVVLSIAYAIPSPQSITGYALDSDGITQVLSGTYFSMNNTNNGYYIQGLTGRGPSSPGKYSVVIDGNPGDIIIVKAWNLSHSGNTSVVLAGSMYNVNTVLNMTRSNIAPVIVSTPATVVAEKTLYVYDVDAEDPFDILTFWLSEYPSGMAINASTGLIEWSTSNQDGGLNNVTVHVNDSQNLMDTQSFTINVTPVNDPPVITSTPILSAMQDVLYEYQVTALDLDNENNVDYDDDVLVYGLSTKPDGMTINSSTGLITWLPGNADAGNNSIVITVSDGEENDMQSFDIYVENVNDAPTITSSPVIEALANTLYTYQVVAVDIDTGDVLHYNLLESPEGMIINSSSGLIEWVPASSGTVDVIVVVSDGALSDEQNFTISVTSSNGAPTITSMPATVAVAGQEYTYTVLAVDPNDDEIVFSLITYPENMTINSSTGLISWIPSVSQEGVNSILVRASDGELYHHQSFSVTVSVLNTAPLITSVPLTNATQGADYFYDVIAYDADGDSLVYSLVTAPSGMTIGATSGLIRWMPTNSHVGNNSIIVAVSDEESNDTQSFSVYVYGVNDAPVITSVAPTLAVVDVYYTYQIAAYDIDNENNVDYDDNILAYSLTTFPAGMTINSSGYIVWLPRETHIGEHNIVVAVSDGSLTITQGFTIRVNAAPVSRSGGSGGSAALRTIPPLIEAYPSEEAYLEAIEKLLSGGQESIPVREEGIAVTEFQLSAKADIDELKLTVYKLSARPINISSPIGGYRSPGDDADESITEEKQVYQYLVIDKGEIDEQLIENTIIKFRISKEWIHEKQEKKENVVMMRFKGDIWQDLPTLFDYEEGDYMYYKAITPGFSLFAIVFKDSRMQADLERPTIASDSRIYASSPNTPYHIRGFFYASDNKSMLKQNTAIRFFNTDNNFTTESRTGGAKGSKGGSYSVLMQGRKGDIIYVEAEYGRWNSSFMLAGDGQVDFTTSISPTFIQRISSNLLIIFLFAVAVVLGTWIYYRKKLKKQIARSRM